MVRECDVMVVGAGPAGATAARYAASQGLRTVLIDRAAFPRDKICGGLITRRALNELPADLPTELVEAAPVSVRLVDTIGREVLAVDREMVGQMVARRDFDAHLVAQAVAAGADFHPGTMIGCLGYRPDGRAEVETPQGSWHCGYVIAADGAFSTTGLLAGFHAGWSEWEEGVGLALDIPTGAPGAGLVGETVEFHLQPLLCGLAWVFPRRDGLRVGMAATTIERGELMLQFERFLRFLRDRLRVALPDGRPRAWCLPVSVRRRPLSRGRVLLTGDAAGLLDPMTGDGIYAALVSGRLAAKAAVAGIRQPTLTPAAVGLTYGQWVTRELQRDRRAATTLTYLLGRKGRFLFDVIRANPSLAGQYLQALVAGNRWPRVLSGAVRNWPLYCLGTMADGRHRRREETIIFEQPH